MNIQLTDAQLAAATTIPKETDISTTGAYSAPAALSGQTAKLNLRVVHESSGSSLGGKTPAALFLLATPILVALNVASAEDAERTLHEAQQAERESAQGEGSAAFHRDRGAGYFLDSVLRSLHDDEHLRQTTLSDGDHIVLPAPAQGKGKDPAAGGPSGPTPATAALPAVAAAPSIPPTPAPATATAAAAAVPTTATPTAAATLAQQGEVAARKETAEFLGVVRAADADTEVTQVMLRILQVMRNVDRLFTWTDLRAALEAAYRTMRATGESSARLAVIDGAISRGERLLHSKNTTQESVLDLFTNMLPSAHGVSRHVFAADIAALRKATMGGGSGMGYIGGVPFPSAAVGISATGPPSMHPAYAAAAPAPGPVPYRPRQRARQRGQPRQQQQQQQQQGIGATAGRGGGGGGRGQGGGATPSQRQAIVVAREARNRTLQQQQEANPGPANGRDTCRKCQTAGRNASHPHLTCAFWVCANCKEAGHRESSCMNPFAPF